MFLNIIILVLSPAFINGQRNGNFNQSGNMFVQQYYQQLDNTYLRSNLKSYYDATDSMASLNGELYYGSDNIMAKILQLPKIVNRTVVIVDNQPKLDGGIVSNIFGKVQIDNGTVVTLFYSEMFLLQWRGSFYIQHQFVRIYAKNVTATNDTATTSRPPPFRFS